MITHCGKVRDHIDKLNKKNIDIMIFFNKKSHNEFAKTLIKVRSIYYSLEL